MRKHIDAAKSSKQIHDLFTRVETFSNNYWQLSHGSEHKYSSILNKFPLQTKG